MGIDGLPDVIGRYEVRGVLGRGGMGRVIAAHDPVLRRDVALKLVEPANVALEQLAEVRFMFHREARATASLRHPCIIEVYDYSGPEADLMYIACERIEGRTVGELIDDDGALPVRSAAALGYELAGALAHAHTRGIVHRDLKPDNIFWTREGRIVLADFGIAKAFGGGLRLGGTVEFGATTVFGSPAYMAPEQLEGGEIGPAVDLYALGALLYECLSGVQAFSGPDIEAILRAVVGGERKPLREVAAVPPRLERLVEMLLARVPADRPPDAATAARVLRGVLDELGVGDPRLALFGFGDETAAAARTEPAPAPPRPKPTRRSRAPLLAGGLALAVAFGAGALLFTRGPTTAASVSVTLEIRGSARVLVDGREAGTWSQRARLELPPGRHVITAGNVSREVVVLPGTTPTFDLSSP